MDSTYSPKVIDRQQRATDFLNPKILPAESVQHEPAAQVLPAALVPRETLAPQVGRWDPPPIMEDLKGEAGLSNLECAPLAEISGHSPMLLPGEICSGYAMTEPDVASSDANNIRTEITEEGEGYRLKGRKWWSSGAMSPRCQIAIVMGLSAPNGERYRRHTMIAVPMQTPGVNVMRSTSVFGFSDGSHGNHAEIDVDVWVPRDHLLGELHAGFAIAKARLGPGRIHHAMRLIGMTERAFGIMSNGHIPASHSVRRLRSRACSKIGSLRHGLESSKCDCSFLRRLG